MSEPGSYQLTPLQADVLRAFFERERGFFLTGDAALVGYYLHHRETTDLDLFATEDGGCTPATLAWLLSQITTPDGARLPGGIDPRELQTWLTELVGRLRRAAAPR